MERIVRLLRPRHNGGMEVETMIPEPEARQRILTAERNLKMAKSSHRYVRGSTQKFYEWLETEGAKNIPNGPPIWICGDCHIGNLGPIADAKGRTAIQIRDLDQTVIGNPAHDLIRLGLSLASAARGCDLPGVTTARMLEEIMEGYEQAFEELTDHPEETIEHPDAVRSAMKQAMKRSWKHLAHDRIEDSTPKIPLGKRFWPLSKQEKKEIKELFAQEDVRQLVTSLHSRDSDAKVKLLDAAYWMKRCSSLGHLRYAVVLGIGKAPYGHEDLCLVDIKEAVKTSVPRSPKKSMPRDNAARVVTGAQHLSPYLGKRMLAAHLLERTVVLRELMPQDLKLDMEDMDPIEAIKAARFFAVVVGKAHARQMDQKTRQEWLEKLKENRTQKLDAPSWLWTSIVELLVSHEAMYLEHCRKYALALEKADAD